MLLKIVNYSALIWVNDMHMSAIHSNSLRLKPKRVRVLDYVKKNGLKCPKRMYFENELKKKMISSIYH